MQWERHYFEALIDHLKPNGDVLQVGFSSSIAAERIQSFHPKHHTIIEPDPQLVERARKWAGERPGITILADRWQQALPKLGRFDAIFYDDFNPEREIEKAKVLAAANEAVRKGKELVNGIKAKFPDLFKIKYADADLDPLFNQFEKTKPAELAHLLRELFKNEQISHAQYEKRIARLGSAANAKAQIPPDPVLAFLKTCLKSHMRKGSRFTCFSVSPLSKYENPQFFEEIITNSDYDYEEKVITVDVPVSSEHYKFKEALILLVVKQVD